MYCDLKVALKMTSVVMHERSTPQEWRAHQTEELFESAYSAADPQERRRLLDEVIVLNMAMADSVVARYTGRGVAAEDLRQVAYAALTRAAHRFDPTQGFEFAAFAVPTMRERYASTSATTPGWCARPGASRSCSP